MGKSVWEACIGLSRGHKADDCQMAIESITSMARNNNLISSTSETSPSLALVISNTLDEESILLGIYALQLAHRIKPTLHGRTTDTLNGNWKDRFKFPSLAKWQVALLLPQRLVILWQHRCLERDRIFLIKNKVDISGLTGPFTAPIRIAFSIIHIRVICRQDDIIISKLNLRWLVLMENNALTYPISETRYHHLWSPLTPSNWDYDPSEANWNPRPTPFPTILHSLLSIQGYPLSPLVSQQTQSIVNSQ